VSLLPSLLSMKPDLKIIVITGDPEFQSAVKAREKGAYDYFVKPIDLNKLRRVVNSISESLRHRKVYDKKEKYHFSADTVDPEAVKIIPERMAKAFTLLAVSHADGMLKVAMADPLDIVAIDTIKASTDYEIEPVIAQKGEIVEAMAKYYGEILDLEKSIQDLVTVEPGESGGVEIDLEQLSIEADDAPVVKLVNLILLQALEQRATDIHIEPREKALSIRFRVDGALMEVNSPPKKMQSAIISRVKILSDLDIAERRLPQDGRCRIRVGQKHIDIRVSTLPTIHGEKVVMRLLDKANLFEDLEKLGLESGEQEKFVGAIERPHGMLLVTGPTGSGKTTTLYTALRYINSSDKNIITVEDPVEYELEGINQVHVKPEIGLSFANALRSILRQDPDVLMIGEIRDLETAKIAVQSALTGHLVFSTLHTNDAVSSVTRLVDMGVEPYLIVSCLNMVIAQRLVRRICPHCKVEYTPSLKTLKYLEPEIGKENELKYYKGAGCKHCAGIGYHGRMAVYEILQMDSEIAELIAKGTSENQLQKKAREKGMVTLLSSGIDKVKQELTTVEEVLRVAVNE
ncbi:MAG: type II secretion system ATPase GspE, partial [Candidatus Latescibacteria bacterium]|nr:type II secretion system ATPase GspE [Candidatus Latescibacterota bacterium]